jgi:hypothetical protein
MNMKNMCVKQLKPYWLNGFHIWKNILKFLKNVEFAAFNTDKFK